MEKNCSHFKSLREEHGYLKHNLRKKRGLAKAQSLFGDRKKEFPMLITVIRLQNILTYPPTIISVSKDLICHIIFTYSLMISH